MWFRKFCHFRKIKSRENVLGRSFAKLNPPRFLLNQDCLFGWFLFYFFDISCDRKWYFLSVIKLESNLSKTIYHLQWLFFPLNSAIRKIKSTQNLIQIKSKEFGEWAIRKIFDLVKFNLVKINPIKVSCTCSLITSAILFL